MKYAFATIFALFWTTSVLGARYEIKEVCFAENSALEAYVVDWKGYGLALEVWYGWDLLLNRWADKRIIQNTATKTRVGYSTNRENAFYADLRIIKKDARFPAKEGAAHLTLRLDDASNTLMYCY